MLSCPSLSVANSESLLFNSGVRFTPSASRVVGSGYNPWLGAGGGGRASAGFTEVDGARKDAIAMHPIFSYLH